MMLLQIINKLKNNKSMQPRPSLSLILTALILLILTPSRCQEQHEQQQFEAFAQHLGDFAPTQSFQFHLAPSEQQTFIYWPAPDVKNLRGMFYITSEDNNGLFMGVEHEDALKKTFFDKKIGVFNVPYSGTGDMKIILKSQVKHLKIYLSYELVPQKKTKKTSSQGGQAEPSQLGKLLQRFTMVRNSLLGQQQILKSITRGSLNEVERLRKLIETKTARVILETVIIFISGFVSIFMLRRELRKGYELII